MPTQTVNPAIGIVEKEFEDYSNDQVNEIIDNSQTAYQKWRDVSFPVRSKSLPAMWQGYSF